MGGVCGSGCIRVKVTFDRLVLDTGEVRRGRICSPGRERSSKGAE